MNRLRFNLILSLLIFLTAGNFSHAQDLLVTAKGDTLSGKVKIIANGYDKRAQLTTADKEKKTFSILQVKALVIDTESYETIKFSDSYHFMKVLKTGYLSLYAFQMDKQVTYDGRYLQKKDGQGIEVPNLGFKKNLSRFLDECVELSSKISEGTLARKDLDTIIDEFNACIARNSIPQVSAQVLPDATATNKLKNWNTLQEQVEASSLEGKSDVLDMIREIKSKVGKGETLPKFLVDGLKASLAGDATLTEFFNRAVREE